MRPREVKCSSRPPSRAMTECGVARALAGTAPRAPGGLPGSLVVIDLEQRIRKRAGWLMRSSPLLGHLKHDWIFTRPSGLGSGFCVRSQR